MLEYGNKYNFYILSPWFLKDRIRGLEHVLKRILSYNIFLLKKITK
jgi:hypothetical protein